MDAIAYNRELDTSLAERGEVARELFLKFSEAHHYDAASTISWLEAKLRVLRGRLEKGKSVSVYDPATQSQQFIASTAELSAWVASNFPGTTV